MTQPVRLKNVHVYVYMYVHESLSLPFVPLFTRVSPGGMKVNCCEKKKGLQHQLSIIVTIISKP